MLLFLSLRAFEQLTNKQYSFQPFDLYALDQTEEEATEEETNEEEETTPVSPGGLN